MSVVTLSLEWASEHSTPKEGWCIKINGLNITSGIDLSSKKFVKTTTAPYQRNQTGTGPVGWVITPTQIPSLSRSNGSRQNEPPMGYVTEHLQTLHAYGYKVVGTHSVCTGEQNMFPIMVWTLQN